MGSLRSGITLLTFDDVKLTNYGMKMDFNAVVTVDDSGIRIDGKEALIEKFIAGREMTVAVLGEKAFPVVEICAKGGWYGYDEKYESDETEYPFPDDPFLPELQQIAISAYKACGCRGVVRVDFRIDESGAPYVLELNTLPGMTSHSLVPKAAAKTGISFPKLCDLILDAAAFDPSER